MGVARPGIDPRINCSRGEALKDSTIDKEHGHYVDVQLLPSGMEVTCRVPSSYAGKDFGSHEGIIKEGDEVYVLIPEGDPTLGPIIVARVWSEKYLPPKLVQDNPKDIVRVLEKDISYRMEVTEKAKVTLKIGDFEVIIDNTSSPTSASFKTEDGDVWKLTKEGLELGLDHDDKMALAQKTKDEIEALRDAVNTLKNTFNDHVHQVKGIKTSGSPVAQSQTAPVDSEKTATKGPSIPAVNDVNSTFVKAN
jgi:hypothetical protein